MQAIYDRLTAIVATKVCRYLGIDPNDKAASPIIDIIIQLLPVILPLIIGCFATPAEAAKQARRPDLIRRLRLRAFLVERIPGIDVETIQLRNAAFSALLDAGATLTDAEMETLAA